MESHGKGEEELEGVEGSEVRWFGDGNTRIEAGGKWGYERERVRRRLERANEKAKPALEKQRAQVKRDFAQGQCGDIVWVRRKASRHRETSLPRDETMEKWKKKRWNALFRAIIMLSATWLPSS
jgi:hypothetical protein